MRLSQYKMKRPPINSALFNVREITKQLLLLEEHLTDPEKFCVDCIRKHLMMVEALAEEAMTMDPRSKWTAHAHDLARLSRQIQTAFSDGVRNPILSEKIRAKRKQLVALVFDSRLG